MDDIMKFTKDTSMNLVSAGGPNFNVDEFSCNCNSNSCKYTYISRELIHILQHLRDHYGRALVLNCGYRCPKHNERVGGVSNSQHVKGNAADIVIAGVKPITIYNHLDNSKYSDTIGLGIYNTFIHVDVRGTRARWDKRS